MRVFVTGGSGFVGGHVIQALVAAGHEVRAMARSARSAAAVEALGASSVSCALEDLEASHMAGCEAVVHCAAFVEEWGTEAEFTRGNVEGTRRALAAAQGAGVSRFVHIGTEAAFFVGEDLVGLDESAPYPASQRYLYSKTKAEAERLVLGADREGGMRTISLRPRLVWGPGDTTVLPTVVKMAREGRFVWLDGGQARSSTTHVANLSHAVVLALGAGGGGEAYFVADEGEVTLRSFLGALMETQGVTPPTRSLPGWLGRGLGRAVEGVWRALGLGGAPPIHGFPTAMMSRTVTVDWGKAKARLGYAPVISREAGLEGLRG